MCRQLIARVEVHVSTRADLHGDMRGGGAAWLPPSSATIILICFHVSATQRGNSSREAPEHGRNIYIYIYLFSFFFKVYIYIGQ